MLRGTSCPSPHALQPYSSTPVKCQAGRLKRRHQHALNMAALPTHRSETQAVELSDLHQHSSVQALTQDSGCPTTRRTVLLATLPLASIVSSTLPSPQAQAAASLQPALAAAALPTVGTSSQPTAAHSHPDYTQAGPFRTAHLPHLEHACTACYPNCVGPTCMARIEVIVPKGGAAAGLHPPYPLAIITNAFLVDSGAYDSYAHRLASWGYTVLQYDTSQSFSSGFLDDVTSVTMLRELINYAQSDPLLSKVADTSCTYLVGHSRGGKISVLAGLDDPRVAAVCLLDPVDNTVYAPLAPGFPSAVAALNTMSQRQLPIAIVAAGLGGDCAPMASNHKGFYDASRAPTLEVVVPTAGHLQYLDSGTSPLLRAMCVPGTADESSVRALSAAVVVAWAEATIRRGGAAATAGTSREPLVELAATLSATGPEQQPAPLVAGSSAVAAAVEDNLSAASTSLSQAVSSAAAQVSVQHLLQQLQSQFASLSIAHRTKHLDAIRA